ncbi:MAG TPA: aldehyde dehydrogenase family protein, partial [Streptosporangiaceae bacterium]|nr:aldehyde dehydrogenase family protein [Streptosporangiaceae bacterium]
MRSHDRFYIGGQWVAPAGSATLDVISPHTEEVVGRVPDGTPADMDRAVAAARDAFDNGPWPRMDPADRAAAVGRLADVYAGRLGEIAELITEEMGSPITFSQLAQAPQPQMMLSYFAELGKTFTWEDDRPGIFGPVTVRREPVGVVAAIVPWNVPQFTTMTKLPAALVAGCTVVIKPAPETPLDAYLLADLIEEAELPPGVVNIVPAGRDAGEHLVSHPGVDKVAFTGSTAAGRRIGSICGQQLKRCSLELGGKSAAIILDDADLAATVGWLEMASLMNNGQACVAQTRILAPRSRYDETVDALAAMVNGLMVGDPADPSTQIGPL